MVGNIENDPKNEETIVGPEPVIERKAKVEKKDSVLGKTAAFESKNNKPIKEVMIPGELVEDRKGRKIGGGVYTEKDKMYAKVLGIPFIGSNEAKIIPMSGVYIPRINDRVIGIVEKVEISGWLVNINSPYVSFLPVSDGVDEFVDVHRMDISRFFDVGDAIFCKVSKVTKDMNVRVSMRGLGSRKLYGGSMVKIKPTKVPRIIGKGGSMINMIKNSTGCSIYVGKNGVVWVRGENRNKAIEAIMTIEQQSHTVGLTDKIESMLNAGVKKETKMEEKN